MKHLGSFLLMLALVGFLAVGVQGQDKKEEKTVTLKGSISCTKCELKETSTCGHFIKVKEGTKEVIYYILDKGAKEPYHGKVCTAVLPGSVTGQVGEKDKKKTITPTRDGVKFD